MYGSIKGSKVFWFFLNQFIGYYIILDINFLIRVLIGLKVIKEICFYLEIYTTILIKK